MVFAREILVHHPTSNLNSLRVAHGLREQITPYTQVQVPQARVPMQQIPEARTTVQDPQSESLNPPSQTQAEAAKRDALDTDLRNGIDAGDPLTAKGRAKKRQRDKEAFDPDDPDRYRYKAYHIRRAFDLFGHIPTIVNDGIKRRAKEAVGEDARNIQNDRDFETFNLITTHLDGLNEDITRLKRNPKAFRALIRKIREAADQARNNDTANLKKDISCMLTPDGASVLTVITKGKKASSKQDRGFENDVMGRYLCPISLDWDNPFIRDEIREGKHAILASDWPRLLYAGCDCNLDDLELGLGRNMALVRVVKYLFTGRSAAFSETAGGKTTRSGNAAIAGMKEMTPRVVAYAACMLRYAISNEESWSSIDKEFNMHEFYWHVVSIFDDSDDFGKELLAWWNLKVFGTSLETTSQTAPPATAALSLLKQQRQAKRAQRPFTDITNHSDRAREVSPESEDDADTVPNPCATNSERCPPECLKQQELRRTDAFQVSTHVRQSSSIMNPFSHIPSHSPQAHLQHEVIRHNPLGEDNASSPAFQGNGQREGRIRPYTPTSQHPSPQTLQVQAHSPPAFYIHSNGGSLVSSGGRRQISSPTPGQPQHAGDASGDMVDYQNGEWPRVLHPNAPTDPGVHSRGLARAQRPCSPVSTYVSNAPPPPPWYNGRTNSSSLEISASVSKPSSSSSPSNGINHMDLGQEALTHSTNTTSISR